jgi:hypothetical protein
MLLQNLRNCHHLKNLNEYLKLVGNDKREQTITDEIAAIQNNDTLIYQDIEFLIQVNRFDTAEKYILNWRNHLNGNFYDILLPLAKKMEAENCLLAASLLYRSLLNSILQRTYNKAYPHAVNYLKILDKLAPNITDWNGITDHSQFMQQLLIDNGRKKSFWAKYNNI